jgi:hypothetical protein
MTLIKRPNSDWSIRFRTYNPLSAGSQSALVLTLTGCPLHTQNPQMESCLVRRVHRAFGFWRQLRAEDANIQESDCV